MLVIVPLLDRIRMLPHFLEHHHQLGATHFALALWNGVRNPVFRAVASLLQTHSQSNSGRVRFTFSLHTSVACKRSDFNANSDHKGLNRIRGRLAPRNGWYCIADLDEFLWFHGRSFAQMSRAATVLGYSALHGQFVDRIAADGSLADVPEWKSAGGKRAPRSSLDDTFPLACNLSKRIGAYCGKICVARSQVAIRTGHHFVALPAAEVWPEALAVHHFKWQSGVREYLENRYAHDTSAGLPFAAENSRALKLITPRVDIHDAALHVRPAEGIGI